ncbi:hypothetical protein E4U30_000851 [Claviceps sp. LM220 group G6]|nr:hypothetical protein E4U30_000851 [Claviceps sp. LM220 group G6]
MDALRFTLPKEQRRQTICSRQKYSTDLIEKRDQTYSNSNSSSNSNNIKIKLAQSRYCAPGQAGGNKSDERLSSLGLGSAQAEGAEDNKRQVGRSQHATLADEAENTMRGGGVPREWDVDVYLYCTSERQKTSTAGARGT